MNIIDKIDNFIVKRSSYNKKNSVYHPVGSKEKKNIVTMTRIARKLDSIKNPKGFSKQHSGLIQKPVQVTRGGKSFVRRQWVKGLLEDYGEQAREIFSGIRDKITRAPKESIGREGGDKIKRMINAYESVIKNALDKADMASANYYLDKYKKYADGLYQYPLPR